MILKFIDIQNEVALAATINIDAGVPNQAENLVKVKRASNIAYGKLAVRFPTPSRQRILTLQTVAEVNTGTASVTEGSRTVAISGATPASAHVGRFFSLQSPDTQAEVYEILSVSGQNYTLRDPYRGDTNTSANYRVFARYYDLPSAVAEVLMVKTIGGIWVSPATFTEFQQGGFEGLRIPQEPYEFAAFSNPATIPEYTVAACASTVDSFTFTGSGFLGTVEPGDRIVNFNAVAADDYQVNIVDSDTSLTLYQRAGNTVASATATFQRRRTTRLWVNPPADKIYHIEYSCLVKIPDMVHDDDEPFMLPQDTQKQIIPAALSELGRYTQSKRRSEWAQEQAAGIEEIDEEVDNPQAVWIR